MVRDFVKKTERGNFTQEALTGAINAVKAGTKLRVAAREYGLSHSTLLHFLKKDSDKIKKPDIDPIFSDEKKNTLFCR